MVELFCFVASFAKFLGAKDTVALAQTCVGSYQPLLHILKATWNKHKLETGIKLFPRVLSLNPVHPIAIVTFLTLEEAATLSQTCTLSDYVVKVLWTEYLHNRN